ncbi:LegC family aminotransferase [Leptospira jelokensis]|uniref:LegC family aminotransferase n=1 Tax=Leptospira jelokensis TaxID=2484931 RepID=UPI001090C694|nr:LegC family aminotransferase [Leptospira jelokensis]TGL99202.1 LegC family aminotransferase [Leptospira jelokensis]
MVKSTSIAQEITNTIQKTIGVESAVLHEPEFSGNEWKYLKECLDSGFVSSVGKFVDRFEKELSDYTGSKYAVAVVNGTSALHIALKLVGVEAGDEVILPSLSFVATANAITYAGGIPHFADSESKHLGLDPFALRDYLKTASEIKNGKCINKFSGNVIRAIVPMHTFGHPVMLDELISVAHDYRLSLVEDSAESLGSLYSGKHTGTFGAMGILSFNGNKTITTGGGGAILTQDENFAKLAKHLTTTAKIPHRYEYVHDQIGYNYRMPNLNAALGCAQLEQLPNFLESKRILFEKYKSNFQKLKGIQIVSEPERCKSNYWLQTILIDKEVEHMRDEILNVTNDNGVMTRPCWRLLHTLAPFLKSPKMDLPIATSLEARLINIPSSPKLIGSEI